MRSKTYTCEKSCVGTFCAQHNYQIKQGMKSPMPCRSCGVGVQADYRLCRNCGGDRLRQMLKRVEIRAKRDFDVVLAELMTSKPPFRH